MNLPPPPARQKDKQPSPPPPPAMIPPPPRDVQATTAVTLAPSEKNSNIHRRINTAPSLLKTSATVSRTSDIQREDEKRNSLKRIATIKLHRSLDEDNNSYVSAFQVTKLAKTTLGPTKLTSLTLHILTKEDAFIINKPDSLEMINDGTSKYPKRQNISNIKVILKAANGTVLHFCSSMKSEKPIVLNFHSNEASDICCRLLFAANKNIDFLDEGETWKLPGKIVEYAAQAGRRNQGSVTSRVGAAFSGSKVILRVHLLERRLELIWGSRHKRYDVSNILIKNNWSVQSKFLSNPSKAKILVPSLDYSSGLLDMDFYFPSPSLKLKFCGHLRAAMIPNVDIVKLRRSGLHLCGIKGQELKVWCGTWNCGDTPSPGPKELSKWIDVQGKFDVYAIGFQECDAKGFKAWTADCKSTFDSSGFAVDMICSVSLWSIHLIVFVRRSMMRFISDVRTDSVACGFANLAGNKGGVGCAFCFNESNDIAFISSHLAARAKRTQERCDDYKNISAGMKNLLSHRGTDFMHQMRHIFWLGDLNYRVNLKNGVKGSTGMDTQGEYEEVLNIIDQKRFEYLQEHDQLTQCMKRNDGAFPYFVEGLLNFAPTYRMNKDKEGYSNKRFQSPSWTDRILVRSVCGFESKVNQLGYIGHHDMMQSDHRPVSAQYSISTGLPYINLSASKSVVNRDRCDILFSDLKVELQDAEALSASIAAMEDKNNLIKSEISLNNRNQETSNPLVEEESFEFGDKIPTTTSSSLDKSEKKKKKKKKGLISKLLGGTVKMGKKAITTVKGAQNTAGRRSVASPNNSGSETGRIQEDSLKDKNSSNIEFNLRFTGDINFLAEPVSSETILVPKDVVGEDHTNMEIEWANEMVPSIVPLAGDFSYVRSQSVLITIRMRREQDAIFHKIGCAEISLSASPESLRRMDVRGANCKTNRSDTKGKSSRSSYGGVQQMFDAPLIHRGIQVGYICGTVRLRNVVQPASSSLSKRWRRRSDMTFTSMTKKKFAEMAGLDELSGTDSEADNEHFVKTRDRSGFNNNRKSVAVIKSSTSKKDKDNGKGNESASGGGKGKFQAWGGMGGNLDDLDAWLKGDDDSDSSDGDIEQLPTNVATTTKNTRKAFKKSYSLDPAKNTVSLSRIGGLKPEKKMTPLVESHEEEKNYDA